MYKVMVISEEGRGGGALGRMRLVAKSLQAEINTLIVLPKDSDWFTDQLRQDGTPYTELLLHPLTTDPWGLLKYILWFWIEVYALYRCISIESPDLVHTNGSWQIKGLLAAKIARKKVVWHMNDSHQPRSVKLLFACLGGLPHAYIYASDRTKSYYASIRRGILTKKGKVIQAPVQDIAPMPKSRNQKQVRLLTVGYINVHKGIDHLYEAATYLDDITITWDIVGPVLDTRQIYFDHIMDIKDHLGGVPSVELKGYQHIDHDLLRGYDLYVCTSRREASPMAVWEALSAGLPVVSTDVGDVASIVNKYHCGMIIPDHDPKQMADTIRSFLAINEEAYLTYSHNALRAATEIFALENVSKEYASFYKEIIDRLS